MEIDPIKGFMIGFLIILVGIFVIVFSAVYSAVKSGGKAEYGGAVVIGPIPIIFGSSERAVKIAVIGAIILMALAIGLIVFSYMLSRNIISKLP